MADVVIIEGSGMKTLIQAVLAVIVSSMLGCSALPHRSESAVQVGRISNAEVTWDFVHHIGWMPGLKGTSHHMARNFRAEFIPYLIEALKDPDRFIAAHTILTGTAISSYQLGDHEFNGLAVEGEPGETALVRPEQRFALYRKWSDWHSSESRRRHKR